MNAVINLNKPLGISSQQAVIKVRKLFRAEKAGHAGTLDPEATGILLVCLDEATKITRFISDLDKEYVALMKLGETTDTFDAAGRIIRRAEGFSLGRQEIEDVLGRFRGMITQTVPMYSAVKINGSPLYKLARKGIEIPRPDRRVFIKELELLDYTGPFLRLRVKCSKGTYIRSLCNDIGDMLGVGGHVRELKRVKLGDFTIESSAELSELPERPEAVFSISFALRHLKDARLAPEDFRRALNGCAINCFDRSGFLDNEYLKLRDPAGEVFGIGQIINNKIKIERLFRPVLNPENAFDFDKQ